VPSKQPRHLIEKHVRISIGRFQRDLFNDAVHVRESDAAGFRGGIDRKQEATQGANLYTLSISYTFPKAFMT